MKSRVLLPLLPVLLAGACGTVRDWHEVKSKPTNRAEVYDAIEFLARTDGFVASAGECDRGLGTWSSRWRQRQIGLGRPGRYRLLAEVLVDEGSDQDGWTVRFLIEQQKVKDLGRSREPAEEDWDDDGQDQEKEFLFGRRLAMRLGVDAEAVQDSRIPAPGSRR